MDCCRADLALPISLKPTALHFGVVNVFDKICEIPDGSGIGVFTSQFGPRRRFFFGISRGYER
jgi:hypothetical protein